MISSRCQKLLWRIFLPSATTFSFLAASLSVTVAQVHPVTLPVAPSDTLGDRSLYADQPAGHSHSDPSHSDHSHAGVEVSATQPLPTVKLVVHPDAKQGWNLEVRVTHFAFAPAHINQASRNLREGHAHLYINGKKVTRLYSGWYYLESLPPGEHRIRVTLNTNSHAELRHQGKPIEAIATIKVP